MNNQRIVGAILAAGRGTRMAPFSHAYPKPLLPICNRPLIEHQIVMMKSLGITDILVLIGHKGFEISKTLGDGARLGVRLRYVEQTAMLGIAHAVGHLEPYIRDPFVLMLGDIFFLPSRFSDLIDTFWSQGEGAVLAVKDEEDKSAIQKGYSVLLDERGFARKVIEKPRFPTERMKGVGIYLFDPSIFDAIRRTPRTAMRDEYEITEAIQVMIDDGRPVRISHCIGDDINLTFPVDLLQCNLLMARQIDGGNLIHRTAQIHLEARLENVIVGSGAVIRNPISVRDTLILDDSLVETFHDLAYFIVTPDGMVDCRHDLRH